MCTSAHPRFFLKRTTLRTREEWMHWLGWMIIELTELTFHTHQTLNVEHRDLRIGDHQADVFQALVKVLHWWWCRLTTELIELGFELNCILTFHLCPKLRLNTTTS